MPYIYYAYITPKNNYLLWKDYLNIEKKCWDILLNDSKYKLKKSNNDNNLDNISLYPFEKIFNLINNEKEFDYLYTGEYTTGKLNQNKNDFPFTFNYFIKIQKNLY